MKIALAMLLTAALAAGAAAQDSSRVIREYAVPSHGKFVLEVPSDWQQAGRGQEEPPSAHILVTSAATDRFRIQVSAIWLDAEGIAKSTPEDLKETLRLSAREPLQEAVEPEAELLELKGAQSHGWYYALTDREVPAGEYKYLIQGIQLTGELLTVYTVLYHDAALPERQAILDMFAGARHLPN